MRRWVPVALLGLAAAVRLAYFLQIRTSPLFENPVFDAREYAARATEIAGGDWLAGTVGIHGPAYPWFLAALARISGNSLAVMTFANGLLGVATVALLAVGVRRLLGEATAAVAAALVALSWVSIHFEGHLLATTWFTFLTVAAFAALARVMTAQGDPVGGAGRAAGSGWVLAAGLLLGAATLTRPNALAIVPFAALLLGRGPRSNSAGHGGARAALLFLAGVFVLVGPLLVRNHQIGGRWILQSNTAFNLYLGNHPESPGYPSIRPGRDWDELVAEPGRAGAVTPAAQEAWFRGQVVRFAREQPVEFLQLQVRKLLLFLNHREVRTTLSPYFFERFAPLQASPLLVGFGILGPLALVGLVLSLRSPARFALPWVFTLPPAALVVLTVMGSRYRAPLLPFLAIFAAHTVVVAGRALRDRRWRRLALPVVLLTPAIALVHIRFADLHDLTYGEETARVAAALQQKGDAAAAARWWEESLREDPGRAETWVSTASLAQARRDWAALDAVTGRGLAHHPGDWLLSMFRGRALLMLGRPGESLDALRPVLAIRPGDPDLLAGLARAHAAAGRPDSARVWAGRAVAQARRLAPGQERPDLAELLRMAGGMRDP